METDSEELEHFIFDVLSLHWALALSRERPDSSTFQREQQQDLSRGVSIGVEI